ncbi:MAG: hypothetical protein ACKO6I_00350 [Sphingomonadales bacterium]
MKNKLFFIVSFALLMHSCAFVLTGTKQRMRIITREPGVEVWHKNTLLDKTPCVVRIKRGFDLQPPLELRKEGFETQSVPLKRKFNEMAALNFFLPVNWLIDGFSGAAAGYKAIDTVTMKRIDH